MRLACTTDETSGDDATRKHRLADSREFDKQTRLRSRDHSPSYRSVLRHLLGRLFRSAPGQAVSLRTVQGLREVSIHSGAPIAIAAELVRSNRIVDQLIADRAVFVIASVGSDTFVSITLGDGSKIPF